MPLSVTTRDGLEIIPQEAREDPGTIGIGVTVSIA